MPTPSEVQEMTSIIRARGHALRTASGADREAAAERLREGLQQAANMISPTGITTPPGVDQEAWLALLDSYRRQQYSYEQETSAGAPPAPSTAPPAPVEGKYRGAPGEPAMQPAGVSGQGLWQRYRRPIIAAGVLGAVVGAFFIQRKLAKTAPPPRPQRSQA